MHAPDRFTGKVALVTGAARGIGRAVAERLAEQGAAVAVADLDGAGAEAVATGIGAAGGTASSHHVDLADRAQRGRLVGAVVERWGHVDILVNNAAFLGERMPALELTAEDWDRVLETNLTAPAFLARDAAADMATRHAGAIINLASLHEVLPVPTHTAYASSKGGVAALTRALAVELADHGIRVNAVLPAVVDTPSMSAALQDPPGQPTNGTPPPPTLLRRFGLPAEVAAAVAFLAGDEASYVTGTLLRVDGGRAVSRHPEIMVQERLPSPQGHH